MHIRRANWHSAALAVQWWSFDTSRVLTCW
jgi:hypothetical protein